MTRVGRLRVAGVTGTAAALILALSGFYAFEQVSTQQQDVIGDVTVTASACISGRNACDTGNSQTEDTAEQSMDGLIAIRIPTAAQVDSITVAETSPGSPARTVEPDPAYSAELERTLGTGADQKWAGFRTRLADLTAGSRLTYTAHIPLGKLDDPTHDPDLGGRFAYQVVTGSTQGTPSGSVPGPLDCGNQGPYKVVAATRTICIDTPGRSASEMDRSIDVRDLQLYEQEPEPLTAEPGDDLSIPFDAVYYGSATPAASFDFDASSDLPGGGATAPVDGFTPGSSSNTEETVGLSIPSGADPGTYHVTLTAILANGQTRSETKTVKVVDATPPQTTITSAPKATTKSRKASFRFSADEPSGFRCSFDGKAFTTCKSPKAYKRLKPGKHKFKVAAVDLAGNEDPSPASKSFKVKKK